MNIGSILVMIKKKLTSSDRYLSVFGARPSSPIARMRHANRLYCGGPCFAAVTS